jgi:hypothetical protein
LPAGGQTGGQTTLANQQLEQVLGQTQITPQSNPVTEQLQQQWAGQRRPGSR